jgi:hypothetical protein
VGTGEWWERLVGGSDRQKVATEADVWKEMRRVGGQVGGCWWGAGTDDMPAHPGPLATNGGPGGGPNVDFVWCGWGALRCDWTAREMV